MSKLCVVGGLMLLTGPAFGFLGTLTPERRGTGTVPQHGASTTPHLGVGEGQGIPSEAKEVETTMAGLGVVLLAAVGVLASKHPSKVMRRNYGGFKPVVGDRYAYTNDVGYLADGTPINRAGNNSLRPAPTPPPFAASTAAPPVPPVAPVAPPVPPAMPPVTTPPTSSTEVLHGVSFSYSMQKDAYADLEFLNDVGYLPDGTPMNMAGNCLNHPERIQPDPHTPGSPLPRANFHNSVGYLPDGTAMNAAGNAVNHPERMQPDMHVAGSPLPKSAYSADVGYFADGTDMKKAGNNSAKAPLSATCGVLGAHRIGNASAFVGTSAVKTTQFRQPSGFAYSMQKDVYVDYNFCNDVGYLPDGTAMNKAGNAMNHPERIQADPHTNGSPLPRALFANDVGYLPDGTAMNRAGNALNHPERGMPADSSSALPTSAYAADMGYFVDGTPLDGAGNHAVR